MQVLLLCVYVRVCVCVCGAVTGESSTAAALTSSTGANVTLTSSVTSSETSVSSVTMTTPSCGNAGGFDRWSFVGGIVLGLGLMVLGYVGYRLYRSRKTDTPYHQF